MTDARIIIFVDTDKISNFIKLLSKLDEISIESNYKFDPNFINEIAYSLIEVKNWIQISLPIKEWAKLNYFYLKTKNESN